MAPTTRFKEPLAQKDEGQKHVTQSGEVFEVPDFTMKQIYDAIPPHCFKPSTLRSMAYVARDYLYVAIVAYAASYIQYIPNQYARGVAWAAYSFAQGIVFTGIWILAHECGHGAFSKSKRLNNIMGLIMHSFLLVPFHSWKISHSAHHKSTGNIEKDTAFVPHTRESWVKKRFGPKAEPENIEFSHLTEDAPLVTLWHCFVHQFFGWPGYLFANLTGQTYDNGFPQISHFYFGKDSCLYKPDQLPLIVLSDIGIAAMIGLLFLGGQLIGSWNMVLYYVLPYLWVNNWIVAITFLQHTDGSLPHYDNRTWNFARGATATIDRDLGFIDTHFFHDIIGTHVLHHLVSTIPFYHAEEATTAIRKVMGQHYRADRSTPFWTAFWRNQRTCKFVEETVDNSGIYFFRNLHGTGAPPKDFGGKKVADTPQTEAVSSGMPTKPNSNMKRRLSQSAQLANKTLPILTSE